jgi:hypothetical protein
MLRDQVLRYDDHHETLQIFSHQVLVTNWQSNSLPLTSIPKKKRPNKAAVGSVNADKRPFVGHRFALCSGHMHRGSSFWC